MLVRGDFALVTPEGTPIETRRGTVALCRCGKSAIKPFCDGTAQGGRFPGRQRPRTLTPNPRAPSPRSCTLVPGKRSEPGILRARTARSRGRGRGRGRGRRGRGRVRLRPGSRLAGAGTTRRRTRR
ncbi:CDGSH iron-sulfur domain-containing protein [Micromonospora sp. Mcm103]|uniref:CDGSH iron-sulfur domain-containing protein n=1 Tax=Micromonospora sp. Mcm103 TaxID=2926015 RepID=UPI0021C64971|nr:CDGSH iron-sulfur domain-containing protein [Micromonospora sp. Mcm103]